jgi:predicted metallo-beta-lactamase superfamily hydrolase
MGHLKLIINWLYVKPDYSHYIFQHFSDDDMFTLIAFKSYFRSLYPEDRCRLAPEPKENILEILKKRKKEYLKAQHEVRSIKFLWVNF